jgi:hypothetical protein
MSTTILAPNGLEIHAIGGEKAYKTVVRGDIAAAFHWLAIGDAEPEPVMIIVRNAKTMGGAGYVIPFSSMWRYAGSKSGAPSPDLLRTAAGIVEELGFFADRSTVYRLCDLIVEEMDTMRFMPSDDPNAAPEKRPGGDIEATITVNGKTVAESAI